MMTVYSREPFAFVMWEKKIGIATVIGFHLKANFEALVTFTIDFLNDIDFWKAILGYWSQEIQNSISIHNTRSLSG